MANIIHYGQRFIITQSRHSKDSPIIYAVFVILIILSGATSSAEECGHEELVQCAKPLQIISSTSELSFVTNKAELDKICPDLNAGLHCIRSYTRRCMSITQRQHFNKLYQGTSEVIHELCTEGTSYQKDFLRHAPCLRSVKKEYADCATDYQETMEDLNKDIKDHGFAESFNATALDAFQSDRIKVVCCAFKMYVQCSEQTVLRSCGLGPARFTKKFLDKMASSLMSMHCDEFDSHSAQCGLSALNRSRKKTDGWTFLLFLNIVIFSLY